MLSLDMRRDPFFVNRLIMTKLCGAIEAVGTKFVCTVSEDDLNQFA